jgi:hypothetical protein
VAAGGGLKRFQGPTGFQQLLTHINLISSVNQKSFGEIFGAAGIELLHPDHCSKSTGFQHLLTPVNSVSSVNQKSFAEIFGLRIVVSNTATNQLVFSIF